MRAQLVQEAALAAELEAGHSVAPQVVEGLSAVVAAALLQGCVKQIERRVRDATGMCAVTLVSRIMLRELQVVFDMSHQDLAKTLDKVFINASASASLDID